jgi:hypothetical protein
MEGFDAGRHHVDPHLRLSWKGRGSQGHCSHSAIAKTITVIVTTRCSQL